MQDPIVALQQVDETCATTYEANAGQFDLLAVLTGVTVRGFRGFP